MGRTTFDVLRNAFGVKTLTPDDPGIIKLAKLRSGFDPRVGKTFNVSPTSQINQLLGKEFDERAALARSGAFDRPDFLLDKVLPVATAAVSLVSGGAAAVAIKGASFAAETVNKPRRLDMAFSDGDSGFFGSEGLFGGVSNALQGGLGQQLLGIGTQALSGFVQQQFAPQVFQTNMAAVGPVTRGLGAVAVVGRGFFNRFPELAAGIQRLRNAGANVTRAQLWSLMKRFGPDFLISGGILTAAAVSQLAVAGPGRRRMNPGNVKALRRAHRRMKSFHNVCVTNDRLMGGRKRSSRRPAFGGVTSVTNVK